jgi:hypothetical protein
LLLTGYADALTREAFKLESEHFAARIAGAKRELKHATQGSDLLQTVEHIRQSSRVRVEVTKALRRACPQLMT